MFELGKIIGLRVHAIKGYGKTTKPKLKPSYILFDDGKTYIELSEPDFSSLAYHMDIHENETMWKNIETFSDANRDKYKILVDTKPSIV